MNPFGDGSDGALYVPSGTTNLQLNRKYQFTSVYVGTSATLSTNSTTGSVLYITAQESITINGKINVSNKVNYGHNNWSVTIDGITYSSPGVADGGDGRNFSSTVQALSYNGFGGGGSGVGLTNSGTTYRGGNGGDGGNGTDPNGGNAYTATRTSNGTSAGRNDATDGGGGSGLGFAFRSGASASGSTQGTGGAGGETFGSNGAAGSGSQSGTSTTGSWSYNWYGGGGGGAGGRAGRAGVHVVLKAPTITINGQIITSGTDGTDGGNGGRTKNWTGDLNSWGMPGGGGGGGNAGSIEAYYSTSLIDTGTMTMLGGDAGQGGSGGPDNITIGLPGSAGSPSTFSSTQIAPAADFSGTPLTGQYPLTVNFTDLSGGADSYTWNFGDSSTSTVSNPTHTYTNIGTYTVTQTVGNETGSNSKTRTNYIQVLPYSPSGSVTFDSTSDITFAGNIDIKGSVSFDSTSDLSVNGYMTYYRSVAFNSTSDITFTGYKTIAIKAIERKSYLYKVYTSTGTYMGILPDVITEFNFAQEINSPGSAISLEIARNSDSKFQKYDSLTAPDGTPITTMDGREITLLSTTNNNIGAGTAIDLNNRIDVYVFYGSQSVLTTPDGVPITTMDLQPIYVNSGAPNGRRVYSGYISGYNSRYGSTETVDVQLMSYGDDLSNYVLEDSLGKTKVPYLSVDPSTIFKDSLTKFNTAGGVVTYNSSSIDTTGTTVSYTYQTNTELEVLNKGLELTPSGWYWYVDLGTNLVHLHEKKTTPKHMFILGKHIQSLDVQPYMTDLVNTVYFTGGEVSPGVNLYKKYTNPTSIAKWGRKVQKISDSRVTTIATADTIANATLDRYKDPSYRSSVTILAEVYEIENISVGDMIGFRNFGNYVDSLVMQVAGKDYHPDYVTLQLDTLTPNINKRIQDISRNLDVINAQANPELPS